MNTSLHYFFKILNTRYFEKAKNKIKINARQCNKSVSFKLLEGIDMDIRIEKLDQIFN